MHSLIQNFISQYPVLADFIYQRKAAEARAIVCDYFISVLKQNLTKPVDDSALAAVEPFYQFDLYFHDTYPDFIEKFASEKGRNPEEIDPRAIIARCFKKTEHFDFRTFIYSITEYLTPEDSYYIEPEVLIAALYECKEYGFSPLIDQNDFFLEHDKSKFHESNYYAAYLQNPQLKDAFAKYGIVFDFGKIEKLRN